MNTLLTFLKENWIIAAATIVWLCAAAPYIGKVARNVLGKEELEYEQGGDAIRPNYRLEQKDESEVSGVSFLDLEHFHYRHPVGGVWKRRLPFVGADNTEELVFFVAVANYHNETDYHHIRAVFEKPLRLEHKKVSAGIHNWFKPNFDLENLPACATGAFWLGFNGSARAQGPGYRKMILGDFEATDGSNRNGTALWPIKLQESKYKYLKIIVLEETGHKQLRKILRKIGTGQNGSVVLNFGKDWLENLAKVTLFNAATKEILKQFSQNKLIDIEYFYESKPAAETIPLRHLRVWNEKPDTPSLEILLEITHRPARLVEFPNPWTGVGPR